MGWISIAGFTIAAGIFLITLYNKKQDDRQGIEIKGVSGGKHATGKSEKKNTAEEDAHTLNPRKGPVISIIEDNEGSSTLDDTEEYTLFRTKTVDEKVIERPPSGTIQMPPPPRPASAPIPDPLPSRLRTMPPPSSLSQSRNRSPPRLKPATASIAPRNSRAMGFKTSLAVPPSFSSGLRPPPSSASTLRVPPQKVLSNTKMQPSLAPTTSTLPPASRPSRKVLLAPGHSPLDWAALQRSTSASDTVRLRGSDAVAQFGPTALSRITPTMLKRQTGRKGKDAWTVYQGKVYNISTYLSFHPGGEAELLRGAGRHSDELFAEVHPWVNWDGMLAECLVGVLVNEFEGEDRLQNGVKESGTDLDSMD